MGAQGLTLSEIPMVEAILLKTILHVIRPVAIKSALQDQGYLKPVLYRSKMNPTLKRNFAVFPVLDWIAEITAHIPNKGEQLVRYHGYYSNVSRGKRKKEKPEGEEEVIEIAPPPVYKELKRRWSHFIQKVYGTDPLVIPSEHWLCPYGDPQRPLLSLQKSL